MVVVVLDSSAGLVEDDWKLLEAARTRRALVAANKADLRRAPVLHPDGLKIISTSALTGTGIEELRAEILDAISGNRSSEQETGFLTNVRHQRLVEESLMSLAAGKRAVTGKIPHEMIMIDLYGALRPLDAITGETTADDILNLIFSSFCIGK
jgi:tRNA modification GTPase